MFLSEQRSAVLLCLVLFFSSAVFGNRHQRYSGSPADESDFPVDAFDAALDAAVDALEATPAVEPEVADEPEDDYYADYEDYVDDGDEEK